MTVAPIPEFKALLWKRVFPSIEMYVSKTSPRLWYPNAISNEHPELFHLIDDRQLGTLYDFLSREHGRAIKDVAASAFGTLGVNDDAYWVVNLHYALEGGKKDYFAVHKKQPVDELYFLYTMLTSERPSDEIRHEF